MSGKKVLIEMSVVEIIDRLRLVDQELTDRNDHSLAIHVRNGIAALTYLEQQ